MKTDWISVDSAQPIPFQGILLATSEVGGGWCEGWMDNHGIFWAYCHDGPLEKVTHFTEIQPPG